MSKTNYHHNELRGEREREWECVCVWERVVSYYMGAEGRIVGAFCCNKKWGTIPCLLPNLPILFYFNLFNSNNIQIKKQSGCNETHHYLYGRGFLLITITYANWIVPLILTHIYIQLNYIIPRNLRSFIMLFIMLLITCLVYTHQLKSTLYYILGNYSYNNYFF